MSTCLEPAVYDKAMIRLYLPLLIAGWFANPSWAGLHYTGETWAELPANWRGYLIDYRNLRNLAFPSAGMPPNPLLERYTAHRDRLLQRNGTRSADEAADLGALLIRLGSADQAVEVLRGGLRGKPDHYQCASNLGTASQLAGDFNQAVAALELAVRLAPPRWKKAEELQLKLVRARMKEGKAAGSLDDLFGIRYTGEPVPPAELPADAVSQMQTLGLWLPRDGRLLWQLGELAFAHGDVATGAAILDGCVTEFGMTDTELRRRRPLYRKAADQAPKAAALTKSDLVGAHANHQSGSMIKFRSPRPLVRDPQQLVLPPFRPNELNQLPWPLLTETTIDRPFRVTFHEHLRRLDGQRVVLTGFMQPLGDGLEQSAVLLLEFPVGCWYCELPEPNGLILVTALPAKPIKMDRELVRVEGRLKLNQTDPEDYLFTIADAKAGPVD